MILSRQTLKSHSNSEIAKPDEAVFHLPEKVLQFGTGVLLRALPDYFIDKANQAGIFNGRIVVVKSTATGPLDDFEKQDGLYTLAVKGMENGKKVEEYSICSAISRVLSASVQWPEILKCAHQHEMEIVISNTTEVGLQLVLEDIHQVPPSSFPAKLLAFLVERYKAFNGRKECGMVIIPTELIPDNGKKLKAMILELAQFNQLDSAIIQWLTESNSFCSSLVDRIVPGKPDQIVSEAFEKQYGYRDNLLTVSEVYRLWAIESADEKVISILSFRQVDPAVIIAPDIEIYRELKLRLLNATHTLSCGAAFLAGFETVLEAMEHEVFLMYPTHLMRQEIAKAIPYTVESKTASDFSTRVLDRFKNPYIRHLWINITQQYTTKMKMRVLPVLVQYYKNFNKPPIDIALGFAAWIVFMRAVEKKDGRWLGIHRGKRYPINDDRADYLFSEWKHHGETHIVHAILKDPSIWDMDLTLLPGFEQVVGKFLLEILKAGMIDTIRSRYKLS